ncbi:MAG: sodium:proton antiporter NhaD, partial [Chlamydiales bacterium]
MESTTAFVLGGIFVVGYLLIILEYYIKVNKTAVALLVAAACWLVYFFSTDRPHAESLAALGDCFSSTTQIIFFLLGAMTLVEMIDAHQGFKILTDLISTTSKRKMLWLVALSTFFLSAFLDNLTTTILMIALLRKMIPKFEERIPTACMSVIAANAGGAWIPIGDITTTMLWIGGQLTTWPVMKALFIPSLVSLLVPLTIFSFREKGRLTGVIDGRTQPKEAQGARLIFCLGIAGLIFVPIFHAWTGLPPFMGMFISLALLWLVTDLLHFKFEERRHLRIPSILTKIDTSSLLFFFGILLTMGALELVGILESVAKFLNQTISSDALLATFLGLFSSVIDNVPLVAATMGMYPLSQHPTDAPLWHMIAYAAGTGGSLLLIGSSSGIALMGMEKI